MASLSFLGTSRSLWPIVFAVGIALTWPRSALSQTASPTEFPTGEWSPPSAQLTDTKVLPSLFTGSATYRIPIDVPTGIGGHQPSLALEYNSRETHGNAGKGWWLRLPKITRSLRYGADLAQTWSKSRAVYEYDGEELIRGRPASGDVLPASDIPLVPPIPRTIATGPPCSGAVRYWRAVERHEKIIFCEVEDYWIVINKSGQIHSFGRWAEPYHPLDDPNRWHIGHFSRLRSPGGQTTFEYYLDEVIEPHGLSWIAEYSAYGDANGNRIPDTPTSHSAPRLEWIGYTWHRAKSTQGDRAIDVQWQSRPDLRPEYVEWGYGFPILHDFRVASVEVRVGTDVVRTYHLRYDLDPDRSGEQRSPETDATLLHSVTMTGLNGAGNLPPITFGYQFTMENGRTGFAPTATYHRPFVSSQGLQPEYWTYQGTVAALGDFSDLNGDGYVDFVDLRKDAANRYRWNVYRGQGNAELTDGISLLSAQMDDRALRVTQGYTWYGKTDVLSDFIDMDADGRPDLFVFGNQSALYRSPGPSLQSNLHFEEHAWVPPGGSSPGYRPLRTDAFSTSPSPHVKRVTELVDANGDGCPDQLIIDAAGTWLMARNKMCDPVPEASSRDVRAWQWSVPPTDYLSLTTKAVTATWEESARLSGLIDMNGDGLIDFFDHKTSTVYMGYGMGFAAEIGSTYAADIQAIFNSLGSGARLDSQRGDRFTSGGFFLPTGHWEYGLECAFFDINGDRFADLVVGGRLGSNEWKVFLNTGRGLRRLPIPWDVPSIGSGLDAKLRNFITLRQQGSGAMVRGMVWRLLDLDHTGTPDLVVFRRGNTPAIDVFRNQARSAGDVLVRITNGLGGQTSLTYRGFLEGPTRDRAAAATVIRSGIHLNRGKVSSAVTVLSTIRTHDGVRTTTERSFEYWTAFHDGRRRSFRGFGHVEEFTGDNAGQFGIKERRYDLHVFYNGDAARQLTDNAGRVWHDGPALAGLEVALHSGAWSDRIEREIWTPWIEAQSGPWGGVRVNGRLVLIGAGRNPLPALRLQCDRPSAAEPAACQEEEFAHDAFGNMTRQTNYGKVQIELVAGGTPSLNRTFGLDEVTQQTVYAWNVQRHLVDLPSEVKLCANQECTEVLRHRRIYYDDQPLHSVNTGNVTKEETLVRYSAEPDVWTNATFRYSDPDNPPYNVCGQYGNPLSKTDPEGASTRYSYTVPNCSAATESVTVTRGKPAGQSVGFGTIHRFDERFGIDTSLTYPNGRAVSRQLDALGRVTYVRGNSPIAASAAVYLLTSFTYGSLGTPAQNYTERVDYATPGTIAAVKSRAYVDGFLRPRQEMRHAGGNRWIATWREYDFFGNVLIEALPFETSTEDLTTFSYSARPFHLRESDWSGREIRRALRVPCGNTTCDRYVHTTAHLPWRAEVRDPRNDAKVYRYDSRGRVVIIDELDGNIPRSRTLFHFDRAGNLDWYEGPANALGQPGNRTSMRYDSRGLMRGLLDPNLSTCHGWPCARRFEYDRAGRLVSQTDAKGQRAEFSLDELGRVFLKDYRDDLCVPGACTPQADVVYVWDESPVWDPSPNGRGFLRTATRAGQSETKYWYDRWGRLTHLDRGIAGVGFGTRTMFEYDLMSRLKRMVYPLPRPSGPASNAYADMIVEYEYDAASRVKSVTWFDQITGGGRRTPIVTSIEYDALGRATQINWGNGLRTVTAFNDMAKVEALHLVDGQGARRNSTSYAYYPDGQTLSIVESNADWGWSRSHEYDYADRLVRVQHRDYDPVSSSWQERQSDFAYDLSGNMTYNSQWNTGTDPEDGIYHYDGPGPHAVTRIGSVDFTYDANGATVSMHDGEMSAVYDFDARMTHVENARVRTDLTYDHAASRVRKQWTTKCANSTPVCVPATTSIFYYGPHFEIVDEAGTFSYERYILLEGRRIAYVADRFPGKLLYLHTDAQGSVTHTTDETGQIQARKLHDSFGNQHKDLALSTTGSRYWFTGAETDSLEEFYHLGARQYAPTLGRMVQPDPIVPDAGNPQSLNRYSYAYNNPTRYTDLGGFEPTEEEIQDFLSEKIHEHWEDTQEGSAAPERKPPGEPPPLPRSASTPIGVLSVLLPAHTGPYVKNQFPEIADPLERFHAQLGSKVGLSASALGRNLIGVAYAAAAFQFAPVAVAPSIGGATSGGAGGAALNKPAADLAQIIYTMVQQGKSYEHLLVVLNSTPRGREIVTASYRLVSAIIAQKGAEMDPMVFNIYLSIQQVLGTLGR